MPPPLSTCELPACLWGEDASPAAAELARRDQPLDGMVMATRSSASLSWKSLCSDALEKAIHRLACASVVGRALVIVAATPVRINKPSNALIMPRSSRGKMLLR